MGPTAFADFANLGKNVLKNPVILSFFIILVLFSMLTLIFVSVAENDSTRSSDEEEEEEGRIYLPVNSNDSDFDSFQRGTGGYSDSDPDSVSVSPQLPSYSDTIDSRTDPFLLPSSSQNINALLKIHNQHMAKGQSLEKKLGMDLNINVSATSLDSLDDGTVVGQSPGQTQRTIVNRTGTSDSLTSCLDTVGRMDDEIEGQSQTPAPSSSSEPTLTSTRN